MECLFGVIFKKVSQSKCGMRLQTAGIAERGIRNIIEIARAQTREDRPWYLPAVTEAAKPKPSGRGTEGLTQSGVSNRPQLDDIPRNSVPRVNSKFSSLFRMRFNSR